MNVSIHAITPEVRRSLIGRRAERGIEVLERLLAGGVEVHAQIVLCPGVNDGGGARGHARLGGGAAGHHLARRWCRSATPSTAGASSSSYSDDARGGARRGPCASSSPTRSGRARALGITRFQLSDEFYVAARPARCRAAETYDGYPQFYDGHRDAPELPRRDGARPRASARAMTCGASARRWARRTWGPSLVCGEAAARDDRGPSAGRSRRRGRARTFAVRNDYFGGDVNVTGLIVSAGPARPAAGRPRGLASSCCPR